MVIEKRFMRSHLCVDCAESRYGEGREVAHTLPVSPGDGPTLRECIDCGRHWFDGDGRLACGRPFPVWPITCASCSSNVAGW